VSVHSVCVCACVRVSVRAYLVETVVLSDYARIFVVLVLLFIFINSVCLNKYCTFVLLLFDESCSCAEVSILCVLG